MSSVPVISSTMIAIVVVLCVVGLVYSFSSTLTLNDYSSQFNSLLQPFIPKNSSLFCEDPVTQTNCTLLPHFISTSTNMETILFFGNLFSCFWTTQFISGIAIMTIAGTIGKWYFKRDADKVAVHSTHHV